MQNDLVKLKNMLRQTSISAGNLSVAQQRLGLSKQGQNRDDLYEVWEKTGVAPAGLEDLGVEAGTPLATKTKTGIDNKGSTEKFDAAIQYWQESGSTMTAAQAKEELKGYKGEFSDADYKAAYKWIQENEDYFKPAPKKK